MYHGSIILMDKVFEMSNTCIPTYVTFFLYYYNKLLGCGMYSVWNNKLDKAWDRGLSLADTAF